MPYNSRADVCRLLVEWYDTMSNVKLGGFQPQLEASYVSNQTEDLFVIQRNDLSVNDTMYIVIHRQTVSFYQNSSVWLDTQDRKPSNFTLD